MHNCNVGNYKLWDRDLTAAELVAESGWSGMDDPTDALCWLRFEEQAGSTAHDSDGVAPALDLDLAASDRWRFD
jgi:hypothetical protein